MNKGQTLIEFLISLPLILGTLLVTTLFLKASWDRARCAYLVFEATHSYLIGTASPLLGKGIQIKQEDEEQVTGEGHCGQAHETLTLQKLESAQWIKKEFSISH